MKKATKKVSRLTKKRRLFVEAVKMLQVFFGEDGLLGEQHFAEEVSLELERLWLKPQSGWKKIRLSEFQEAICSALYFMHSAQDVSELDEVHESCAGGEVFSVAFELGWSIGFDMGKEDEREDPQYSCPLGHASCPLGGEGAKE
jgi:hypothetical protein